MYQNQIPPTHSPTVTVIWADSMCVYIKLWRLSCPIASTHPVRCTKRSTTSASTTSRAAPVRSDHK